MFRPQKDRRSVDICQTALHVAAVLIVDTRGTAVQEYFGAFAKASEELSRQLSQPAASRYRVKLGLVEAGARAVEQVPMRYAEDFRAPLLRFGGRCELADALEVGRGLLAHQEEDWVQAGVPFARSAMFFVHRYPVEGWPVLDGQSRGVGCGLVIEPCSLFDCSLSAPPRMSRSKERTYWDAALKESFVEMANELKRRVGIEGEGEL